jgi:four helix bundle protein
MTARGKCVDESIMPFDQDSGDGLRAVTGTRASRKQLQLRTRRFALRIVKVAESVPRTRTGNHIAGQLLRCGTSVGANYRAACRARSTAEFCSKLGTVEEEADECIFWMEMLIDTKLMAKQRLALLMQEANELLSMIVASIKTARVNK